MPVSDSSASIVRGPTNPAHGRSARFRRWWRDRLAIPLVVIGNITIALAPLGEGHHVALAHRHVPTIALLVVVGSVVSLLGLALTDRRAQELEGLRRLLSGERIMRATAEDNLALALDAASASLNALVQAIASELALGSNSRISVYRHEGSELVRLARYCQDPRLNRNGRLRIPDSEGLLGRALGSARPTRTILPERLPAARWALYQVQRLGLSAAVAGGLRMRSHAYLCYPIPDLTSNVTGAVLVLESLAYDGLRFSTASTVVGKYTSGLSRVLHIVGQARLATSAPSTGGV